MSGRGNSRRNGPVPRAVQVSKKLSWLLRHGADKEGLLIGQDGYASLANVLANRNLKSLKITFEELQQVVRDDTKQRYSLIPKEQPVDGQAPSSSLPSSKPEDWLIRANQGHSIKLESDAGLLTPITKDNAPPVVVHGTTHANWVHIATSGGLKPMGRNHVHFAAGLPAGFESVATENNSTESEAAPVISGMRSSSTVLVYLDLPKALEAGIRFGLSQNGVILSEGNEDGLIPLSLLQRVEDRTGAGILLQDGQIVEEAPPQWAKKARPQS